LRLQEIEQIAGALVRRSYVLLNGQSKGSAGVSDLVDMIPVGQRTHYNDDLSRHCHLSQHYGARTLLFLDEFLGERGYLSVLAHERSQPFVRDIGHVAVDLLVQHAILVPARP